MRKAELTHWTLKVVRMIDLALERVFGSRVEMNYLNLEEVQNEGDELSRTLLIRAKFHLNRLVGSPLCSADCRLGIPYSISLTVGEATYRFFFQLEANNGNMILKILG